MQGQWNSCDGKDDGDSIEDNDDDAMEGGGLDDILQWPLELLYRALASMHLKRLKHNDGWKCSVIEEDENIYFMDWDGKIRGILVHGHEWADLRSGQFEEMRGAGSS